MTQLHVTISQDTLREAWDNSEHQALNTLLVELAIAKGYVVNFEQENNS